jgi:hypothetical protein
MVSGPLHSNDELEREDAVDRSLLESAPRKKAIKFSRHNVYARIVAAANIAACA